MNFDRFPQMGRIVPEMDDSKVREVFIYSYRLIYQISQSNIEILAVIHAKRDFSNGNIDKLRN